MSVIINYQKRRPKGPSITCFADVEKIALRSGLTHNTMQMLKDRGYGCVKYMREINEADLEVLPLYVGQQLALSKLVNHLNDALSGFLINDAPEEHEEGTEGEHGTVQAEVEDGLTPEERIELEHQAILHKISTQGIMSMEQYAEGSCAARMIPRPHDFLVGKQSGKGLFMEEFLYGSLLTLEFFMETSMSEVRPYMKHMRFVILKLIHGYPLMHIILYDYGLKTKMERENLLFPQVPDDYLLERYLRLMKKEELENEIKKKKKKKKRGDGKKKLKPYTG